jgi:hypothetical protein
MRTTLPLRCECGKLRGTAHDLGASAGTRIICYCNDCQAFARFLGRSDILDARGGTDIFQASPRCIRLEEFATLACMRLSEKGMFRWYCAECKTPLGNTMSGRVPFIGVIHNIIDYESANTRADDVLGKPFAYVQTRSAIGGPPTNAEGASLPRLIARSVRLLGQWWLSGAAKESTLFDPTTHQPKVAPRVLSESERRAL